jgi:hypothetical protein
MKKNQGQAQQKRGHKRVAKQRVRKINKAIHKSFINSLIKKYGSELKLKEKPAPGTAYLDRIFGKTQVTEEQTVE